MSFISNKQGFTLIELIVVIAIIGLLVTVGAVGYQSVLVKTRDTRRVADFNELVKAMKLYHIENLAYPGDLNDGGVRISAGCASDFINDLVNAGYLESTPTDPRDNANCNDFNDESFFYSFDDNHCCQASTCISINKLETQAAFDQLNNQYANRLTVSNGCDGNIGDACTAERQFHMCFVPN